ncbi:MAG TPA: class I SAM-dependent methyltransferase [Sediminibacterium sp.]|nr:class I SAM-dependent methyltransferase [Sediminibacterium sp.]
MPNGWNTIGGSDTCKKKIPGLTWHGKQFTGSNSCRTWLNIIRKQADYVLDAGCGPAGIFIALKDQQVHAIDPIPDKYRQLPHFQPAQYPWTRFEQMLMENLHVQDTYDRIYCLNDINQVSDLAAC